MKKIVPQQLVCQHIENLSREGLKRYAAIIRDLVARRHGVYALYRDGELYYVGLATDLRGRLNSHLKDRHEGHWDRFSVYLTPARAFLRELESLIMRVARPNGNRQRGKFVNSEDMMRSLERQLREHQRAERETLTGRTLGRGPLAAVAPRRSEKRGKGLAGRFDRSVRLQAKHKDKTYKGVLLPDGSLRHARKRYVSPSSAAKAILGRNVNGWTFWLYERAPGDWVQLSELRRR